MPVSVPAPSLLPLPRDASSSQSRSAASDAFEARSTAATGILSAAFRGGREAGDPPAGRRGGSARGDDARPGAAAAAVFMAAALASRAMVTDSDSPRMERAAVARCGAENCDARACACKLGGASVVGCGDSVGGGAKNVAAGEPRTSLPASSSFLRRRGACERIVTCAFDAAARVKSSNHRDDCASTTAAAPVLCATRAHSGGRVKPRAAETASVSSASSAARAVAACVVAGFGGSPPGRKKAGCGASRARARADGTDSRTGSAMSVALFPFFCDILGVRACAERGDGPGGDRPGGERA